MNNNGPSNDPCGTPLVTLPYSDFFPLICILCSILVLLKESELCDEYERYITDFEVVKHEVCSILVADEGKIQLKPILAIKKLEHLKFCGSIRAFPTFIKDYERLVVSQQGMDTYVLRNSLEGEPRKLMEHLDDYHRMWPLLKETYGNPAKMIASILGDINATKPVIEGDNKKLIVMINTVEKVWLDIDNLGQSQELENTTVFTQVKKLLPTTLRREWAIKVQSIS